MYRYMHIVNDVYTSICTYPLGFYSTVKPDTSMLIQSVRAASKSSLVSYTGKSIRLKHVWEMGSVCARTLSSTGILRSVNGRVRPSLLCKAWEMKQTAVCGIESGVRYHETMAIEKLGEAYPKALCRHT